MSEFDINDEHRLRILEKMGPYLGQLTQEHSHQLADEILTTPTEELEEIREYAGHMAPVLRNLMSKQEEEM